LPLPNVVGAALRLAGIVRIVLPLSTNAILLPSGDTTGLLSAPVPVVSCCSAPPSVTDQILYCLSLLRSDEKMTLVESGYHDGSRSSKGPLVSAWSCEPSGFTTQIA
jgi:hypothetical protein